MSKAICIKINGWDKFNPRKDIKHPSWFAFSNRALEDEEFFSFTGDEFKTWIYVLSKSSQKYSPIVTLFPDHAERVCGIPVASFLEAIKKLLELKIISIQEPAKLDSTESVQARTEPVQIRTDAYESVQASERTRDATDRQTDTEQNSRQTRAYANAAAAFVEDGKCGAIEPFAGSKSLQAPLSKVPKELQKLWIDQWGDSRWVLKTLEKAFAKRLAAGAGGSEDWASTFTSWLWSEREKPKPQVPESNAPTYAISQEQAWDAFQSQLKTRGVESLVKLLPVSKGAH